MRSDFLLPKKIIKTGGYSNENYPIHTINETSRTDDSVFVRNGPSGASFVPILGF
jgi:hypothetical protein